MRQPLSGIAPAQADEPLSQNRFVHQRGPPKRARDVGMLVGQLHDDGMGNLGHAAARQGRDAVIHCPQDKDVKIAKIARDHVGHDLPRAFGEYLVPACKPFEDQVNAFWLVALLDQIGARSNLPYVVLNEIMQQPLFGFGKLGKAFKLANKNIGHRESLLLSRVGP
jgi:hypothetical protein